MGDRRRHRPVAQHRPADERARSSPRPRRPSTSRSSTSSSKNAAGDLGGEDYSGTLANNGVLLSPFHDSRTRSTRPPVCRPSSRPSPTDQGRHRHGLLVPRARLLARSAIADLRLDHSTAPGPHRGPGAVRIPHHAISTDQSVEAERMRLELRDITQALSRRPRERQDLDLRRSGQGPRPARRERRGQDHADEHPVRPLQAGLRPDLHRRRGAGLRRPRRGDQRRRRHGPPALHARPGLRRRRGGRARRGDRERAPRHLRPCRRAQAHRRAVGAVQARRQPGRQDREPPGRRPPAGRDPQGALPPQRHPRPRRAERRPHAARDRGAVHDHPVPRGDRHDGHLHHPQAQRGPRGRRQHRRPATRSRRRHAPTRRPRPARSWPT